MKDITVVNGHLWEQQERGWWTCNWGTDNYGVCHEDDGWHLHGPGSKERRGPYGTMGKAMEQLPIATREWK